MARVMLPHGGITQALRMHGAPALARQ